MLVMVKLPLDRFVCTLLHVSHGGVPLSGFVPTLLHLSHAGVASCQGLSALYSILYGVFHFSWVPGLVD